MRPLLRLALMAPSSAFAATLNVGPTQPYATIGDALAVAVSGDQILVDPGTYDEGPLFITQSFVSIVGAGASSTTIHSVNADTSIVADSNLLQLVGFTIENDDGDQVLDANAATVVFQDIVVRDVRNQGDTFSGTDDGAVAYLHDRSLLIWESGSVDNCRANGDGGAIYAVDSYLSLSDVTISNCRADGDGGAIYGYVSNVTLVDDTLELNEATAGGALHLTNGVLTTQGVALDDNVADEGGGMWLSLVQGTISETAVIGNQATRGGGGHMSLVQFDMVRTDWSNNVADDGAGLAIDDGGIEIYDSTFDGNQATHEGGGLRVAGRADPFIVQRSQFSNNTAMEGGGVWWAASGDLAMSASTFDGNTATGSGGGLRAYGGSVGLQAVSFSANTATVAGGGVYASVERLSMFDGFSMSGNTAGDGGGVYVDALTVAVSNAEFCGNAATTGDGGGLRVGSAFQATTTNVVFSDNTAADDGAAIFAAMTLDINNVDVLGNTAGSEGSVYFEGARGSVVNVIFAGANGGGALGADAAAVSAGISVNYDLFDANVGGDFVGSATALQGGATGLVFAPPRLYDWSNDDTCGNDDWTPILGSPVIDAGDPSLGDPDGTRSDIGAYGGPGSSSTLWVDADGDGFREVYDCDDADPAINPSVVELCNGYDDDCDMRIDDDDSPVGGARAFFTDADLDGYGNVSAQILSCATHPGIVDNGSDCADDIAAVNPGAAEVCNGIDDDCDGAVDDADSDVTGQPSWTVDGDGDGFGDGSAVVACTGPSGTVSTGGDCDDTDVSIHPGADETCDGIDEDCTGVPDDDPIDGGTWWADADGDLFGDPAAPIRACSQPASGTVDNALDCDDTASTVNPGADEACNSLDDDCDGTIDDDPLDPSSWYVDGDADGYGTGAAVQACSGPSGTVNQDGDCDDASAAVNPGAAELCAVGDEDCDGLDGDADPTISDPSAWHADRDADTFGDPGTTALACSQPSGFVADATDCDDATSATNPLATEVCNGIDDDCDAVVDTDAADRVTTYADADGDGYGDADTTFSECTPSSGHAGVSGDCDDANAAVNPGAAEVCDGIDDDCDGTIDVDAIDAVAWYTDADADGFGDPSTGVVTCTPASGTTSATGDCADDDAARYPGAPETCSDAVDLNCDGFFGNTDNDGDGFVACAECDDGEAAVNPDATEICDGVDNDCDAVIDPPSSQGAPVWYSDADGDGYGDPALATVDCSQPSGSVADASDCDDTDAGINPGADEQCTDTVDIDCDGVLPSADADGDGSAACEDCDEGDAGVHPGAFDDCDGIDQDCDAEVDEDAALLDWYADADGDGFGDPTAVISLCAQPSGAVADDTDCDDTDGDVHPGAPETCGDLTDLNCDGSVDDADLDGDGTIACEDCDDDDAGAFPGALEVCDGVDQDCDGLVDDDATGGTTWYADADGDGFGDDDAIAVACDPPTDTVDVGGDCDDTDASVNPDGDDVPDDGIDQDCDGADAEGGDTDLGETDDTDAGGKCGCGKGSDSGSAAGLFGLAIAAVGLSRRGRARR